MRDLRLRVSEIFLSIQGESSRAGLPCVFVRLAGCTHGCAWCDTRYAWKGGKPWTLPAIVRKVASYHVPLVEVTGGEPLEQEGTPALLSALLGRGRTVMLETNGAHDLSRVPKGVMVVMDVKTPSSGRSDRNHWPNLRRLGPRDEVKFVIGDRRDYAYARAVLRRHRLDANRVLFSPLYGRLEGRTLAGWVLRDRLAVRVQVQLHKVLWGTRARRR